MKEINRERCLNLTKRPPQNDQERSPQVRDIELRAAGGERGCYEESLREKTFQVEATV